MSAASPLTAPPRTPNILKSKTNRPTSQRTNRSLPTTRLPHFAGNAWDVTFAGFEWSEAAAIGVGLTILISVRIFKIPTYRPVEIE